MKLLIATGIFPPQIGGPATYSKLLSDKLPEWGFSVDVVNFGDFLSLPKIVRHIAYFFKILLRGTSADIIYAQDPVSVGLPALCVAKILRKKFYLKVVGDYAWEQESVKSQKSKVKSRESEIENLEDFQNNKYGAKTELLKKVERLVARHAEKVIVPSEYLKKIVLLWGVSEKRIRVIYNGFHAPEIDEDKELLRKELGMHGYAIVSVGRLVPWKGFSMLINTMPDVIKRIPDAHLFVAGEGPERKALEQKIAELKLEKYITLLGKLAQKDLFEYIKASDVFVLNTAYEGFSHQLLEVMALGTPIITTPIGGNTEIIEDRKNGLFVPYNDVRSLEKAITKLRKDTALASSLALTAQGKVKEFSDEKMLGTLACELRPNDDYQGLTLESGALRSDLGNRHLGILSISSDRKVFEEGSAVRVRLLEYGRIADELHIIVFAKRSLGFKDEIIQPNIFLYSTNSLGRFFHIPYAILCALKLKRRGVAIDVVTTQDPFECGLAGYIIARLLGARLHIQIHTDFMSPYFITRQVRLAELLNRMRVFFAKFLIPRAHAIRVVSERIKNSLLSIGCRLPAITVLPIFVDTDRIARAPITHDLKKKYPQFEKHILMASRLSPEKNIELAITAMRSVVQKYPKAGLIIVGEGSERSPLLLKAKSHNLTANIVFEGWQNDLASYYKTADLFLLTSTYEGYGMTVVEALATERPVVMTDVGCADEVVHNGENGLVVPVGDVEALTHAIIKIISGEVTLKPILPKMPTKEEYLASYKKSWEDAL